MGDLPAQWTSRGNQVVLIKDGDAMFRAIWDAIQKAKKRVWIEVYIFKADSIGKKTLEALKRAAERDCDVILIYDRFGSLPLSDRFFDPLRNSGAEVIPYNPILPRGKIGQRMGSIFKRDHRKIIIIDDDVGFSGGMNVSRKYAGRELGNGFYEDSMLRINGPAVRHLSAVFLESLQKTIRQARELPSDIPPHPNGKMVQVLRLNAPEGLKTLSIALSQAIESAKQTCYLVSAYFVPPSWFQKALIRASGRGVDVKILTAGRSDVPAAKIAGRHFYGELLRSGIRVYELQSPVLHSKFFTIDSVYSSVGSYNIDHWSRRHNLEINIAAEDSTLAEKLERSFFESLERSEEILLRQWEQRPFFRRIMEGLLYHLSGV